MNKLRSVFDKVTHSSDKWNPYFDVYERHLSHLIGKEFTLVEIGVQRGGSLEMWSNFFGPQCTIIGIDVDDNCRNLKYEQNNIEIVIGDQANPAFWDKFLEDHPKIDVLIDDGGHNMVQQTVTFEKVYPILSVPGIYICEDCHTSYMNFFIENNKTFIEHSKHGVDVINQKWHEHEIPDLNRYLNLMKDLTSLHYYDSVVVFEKNGRPEMVRVFPECSDEK
jgi:23S rRNA U2552 (ribose-2'-O)-methylase RlmE/FtsJ